MKPAGILSEKNKSYQPVNPWRSVVGIVGEQISINTKAFKYVIKNLNKNQGLLLLAFTYFSWMIAGYCEMAVIRVADNG